jgi:hypothetical protein
LQAADEGIKQAQTMLLNLGTFMCEVVTQHKFLNFIRVSGRPKNFERILLRSLDPIADIGSGIVRLVSCPDYDMDFSSN